MELKLLKQYENENWQAPFNRTIMELKLVHPPGFSPVCITFNRTIMELKWYLADTIACPFATFNRTIMELKYCFNAVKMRSY